MSSALVDFLEDKEALEALGALEAAGIDRPSDLQSLTVDDVRGLGLTRRLSVKILSAGLPPADEADEEEQHEEPSERANQPLSPPPPPPTSAATALSA